MNYKKLKVILIISASLFLAACKTTGEVTGDANLTILVVDENGSGVGNCSVILSNFNKSENGITNENGMCVFSNVPSGEFRLTGQKNGYSKLESEPFNFINKGDIFCFEIFSSGQILTKVEQLYEQRDYKNASELLDQVVCDKKSSLYAAICLYKSYGFFLQENKKQTLSELKKMKKADKAFEEIYEKIIQKIEINEIENESQEGEGESL